MRILSACGTKTMADFPRFAWQLPMYVAGNTYRNTAPHRAKVAIPQDGFRALHRFITRSIDVTESPSYTHDTYPYPFPYTYA